jgi:RNA polymerase sigma factor (sigma-70 family)
MDLLSLSDEQLLAAMSPPDAGEAFGVFYERHARLVAAFHMRRVADAELAADLTSETFAQALASRARFVSQGDGSATAWLFGIARFKWLEHERREDHDDRLAARVGAWVRPPLDEVSQREFELCSQDGSVLQSLERLPELQREAVRAYVLGDLDYEEIAAATGDAPATIRKRVSRGLAALRESLVRT